MKTTITDKSYVKNKGFSDPKNSEFFPIKVHKHEFVEQVCFGHPGKILVCNCGLTKVISLCKEFELRDNV